MTARDRTTTTMDDRDPSSAGRADGRDHRVRQPGACPRPEPARVRGRRRGRARARRARAGRWSRTPASGSHRPEAVRAADVVMILVPDTAQKAVYDAEIEPEPAPRPAADVRPRLQHPLQADRPAGRRSTSGWSPRKGPGHLVRSVYQAGGGVPALFAVERDAERDRPRAGPGLRPRSRQHPRRRARDDLRRGDRDRPVRRAVGPVRRHGRARQDGVRDAGRGRLPAGAGLLRDDARAQAHRRPDVPRRAQLHALQRQRHGRVRRLRQRPADHRRPRSRDDEGGPRARSRTARSPGPLDRRERLRPGRFRADARRRTATTSSSGSARSSAARWRSSTRSSSRPARPRPRPASRAGWRSRPDERRRCAVAAGSVRIFDTTLRDGEQAPGAGLTAAEKLEVARQLVRLNVDVIEAGFPAASPGDFEAVQRIARETSGVAVAALARCRDGDPQRAVEAIRAAERPHLHVFIATSDIHLKHKLRIGSRRRARRRPSSGSATAARPSAATPRSSSRPRTPAGPTSITCSTCTRRWSRPGRAPSTSRTPSATPSRPSSARSSGASSSASGGTRTVSVHCHNDLGLATANTLAAVQAGARQVEVTINGLGERAGNASLEEVVMALRTRPTQFPDLGSARPDRADHRRQPPGELLDRVRDPAEQGGRRRQRVRPRVGDPPGRRDQEPADLRDHDPAVDRAVREPADDRQAVRATRPAGQAARARARARRATRSTRSIARRSPSPTRRRRSPTRTSWRSSRRARRRSRRRSRSRAGA